MKTGELSNFQRGDEESRESRESEENEETEEDEEGEENEEGGYMWESEGDFPLTPVFSSN